MKKKDSDKVDSNRVPLMLACATIAVALTVVIIYLIFSGGNNGEDRATDLPSAENTDVAVITEEAGRETGSAPEKTTGKEVEDTAVPESDKTPESEKTPESDKNAGSETVSPEVTGKTFTGDINFDDIPDGTDVTVESGNANTEPYVTQTETLPETKPETSPETKPETSPETKAETVPETKRTGGEDGWSPDIR